ncbi:hypothetical protein Anapl_03867 [Anas platyrhynchos]|uniref:Uncharacterized protein n=1 Tax=Anas platyrhynchos TaxID=8839 RepID=R0L6Y2_ANAPL|nr:hypothetical protein Anapl_03867 [Anas platyrhynchos]
MAVSRGSEEQGRAPLHAQRGCNTKLRVLQNPFETRVKNLLLKKLLEIWERFAGLHTNASQVLSGSSQSCASGHEPTIALVGQLLTAQPPDRAMTISNRYVCSLSSPCRGTSSGAAAPGHWVQKELKSLELELGPFSKDLILSEYNPAITYGVSKVSQAISVGSRKLACLTAAISVTLKVPHPNSWGVISSTVWSQPWLQAEQASFLQRWAIHGSPPVCQNFNLTGEKTLDVGKTLDGPSLPRSAGCEVSSLGQVQVPEASSSHAHAVMSKDDASFRCQPATDVGQVCKQPQSYIPVLYWQKSSGQTKKHQQLFPGVADLAHVHTTRLPNTAHPWMELALCLADTRSCFLPAAPKRLGVQLDPVLGAPRSRTVPCRENIGQAKFEGSLCSSGLQLRGQQSRRSRPHPSGESISGQSPPDLVDLSSTISLVPALWQLERLKRAVTGAPQDLQPVQGCWNIEDAAAGLAEELPCDKFPPLNPLQQGGESRPPVAEEDEQKTTVGGAGEQGLDQTLTGPPLSPAAHRKGKPCGITGDGRTEMSLEHCSETKAAFLVHIYFKIVGILSSTRRLQFPFETGCNSKPAREAHSQPLADVPSAARIHPTPLGWLSGASSWVKDTLQKSCRASSQGVPSRTASWTLSKATDLKSFRIREALVFFPDPKWVSRGAWTLTYRQVTGLVPYKTQGAALSLEAAYLHTFTSFTTLIDQKQAMKASPPVQ